jgi:hypothetical protein
MKNLAASAALASFLLLVSSAFAAARSEATIREVALAPPMSVEPINRDGWDRSTPEKSYLGAYSANKAADKAWIIATFAPTEREAIAKNVNDEQLLDANTALFASIAEETIQRRVEYATYVILVVEARRNDGRRFPRNIPFKPVDGQWFITNDLASDRVFLEVKVVSAIPHNGRALSAA